MDYQPCTKTIGLLGGLCAGALDKTIKNLRAGKKMQLL
jgi:hypothetical protein